MSPYASSGKTRVKWHRKALTASFGDATPAVLWRWAVAELPTGFTLRHEQGQMHLLQSKPGLGESTVAVFSSPAAAERALHLLSRGLLGGNTFVRVLKNILVALGIFFLLLLAFLTLRNFAQQSATTEAAAPAQTAAAPAQPAAQAPAAPAQPVTPAPGTPVDVDQVYH